MIRVRDYQQPKWFYRHKRNMEISLETEQQINETREKSPFLTYLLMSTGEIKVGIIQNETQRHYNFYDLSKIKEMKQQKRFMEYGDKWWWESGQLIPINFFVGKEFDEFQESLVGLPKKAVDKVIGPSFSLSALYVKRIKKRRIEILMAA